MRLVGFVAPVRRFWKLLAATLVAAGIAQGTLTVGLAQASPSGQWQLALNEEFSSAGLNTAVWIPGWNHGGVSGPINHEVCMRAEFVEQPGDGNLYLNVKKEKTTCESKPGEPNEGRAEVTNTASLVESKAGFVFSYGYTEWRVKIEPGVVLEGCASGGCLPDWPALWSIPSDHSTEIDTMEGLERSGKPCSHWHRLENSQVKETLPATGEPGICGSGSFAGGWHTFASDWEPGSVTFYYDGNVVGRTPASGTNANIKSKPQYLIMGIGPHTANCCEQPEAIPAKMTVDYVRVWQHPKIAFQANTGHLWTDVPGEALDAGLAMNAGSSPSITTVESGADLVAFQKSNHHLWIDEPAGGNEESPLLEAGTSPSIASLRGNRTNAYIIAFQKESTHHLWLFLPTESDEEAIVMKEHTSPSIAGVPGKPYVVAAQKENGDLTILVPPGPATDEGLGMLKNTSPSVSILNNSPSNPWISAFQSNAGELWLLLPTEYDNEKLGMAAGTSPSVTGLEGGGYAVAIETNAHELFLLAAGKNVETGIKMKEGTSPSVTATVGGGYEVAYQEGNGKLATYYSSGTKNPLGLGMENATSPSIATRP
jgi:glycosyl hydrolase family 16